MNFVNPLVIFIVVVLLHNCAVVQTSIFAPKMYLTGTILTVKSIGVFSPETKPNEPLLYRALPVCKPTEGWMDFKESIGERIMHEEIINTAYYVQLGDNFTNPLNTLCDKRLPSDKEVRHSYLKATLIYAIENNYRMYFTLDNLPNIYPLITPFNQAVLWGERTPVTVWPIDAISNVGGNTSDLVEELPFNLINLADIQVGVPIGFEVTDSDLSNLKNGFYAYQHYTIHVYGEHMNYTASQKDVFWLDLTDDQRRTGNVETIKLHRFAMYPDKMSAVWVGSRNNSDLDGLPIMLHHTYTYLFYEENSPWITRWTTLFYSSARQRDAMVTWITSTTLLAGLVALVCIGVFVWYSRKGMYSLHTLDIDRDNSEPEATYDHIKWRTAYIDFFRPPSMYGIMNILISCSCQVVFMCIILEIAVLIHSVTNNITGQLDELLIVAFFLSNSVHGVVYGFVRKRWLREPRPITIRTMLVYAIAFLYLPSIVMIYNLSVEFLEYIHMHRMTIDFSEWMELGFFTGVTLVIGCIGFLLSSNWKTPCISGDVKEFLGSIKWILDRKKKISMCSTTKEADVIELPDHLDMNKILPQTFDNISTDTLPQVDPLDNNISIDENDIEFERHSSCVNDKKGYIPSTCSTEQLWTQNPERKLMSRITPGYWNMCRIILPGMYGMLSFAIVVFPLHMILDSMWNNGVDTMYSMTFISGTIWIAFNWVFSCMFVLVMLNHQDPRWHWPCFHFAASAVYYMFLYCIVYWLFFSHMHGVSPFFYYMFFCSMMCWIAWITVGGSSVFVVYLVFGNIYMRLNRKHD